MADSTPKLMTVEQFNDAVKKWTVPVRNRMVMNAKTKTEGKGKGTSYSNINTRVREVPLASSIKYIIRKEYGVSYRVQFRFPKQGIYVHYGVGRGYIRSGNSVSRGYKTNPKNARATGPLKRKAVDWFDVEIRTGINKLADIAQEYYGDEAMNKILENIDRYLIKDK